MRDVGPIGEVWYERAGRCSTQTLLLKVLFTEQPLSIQVHPDDVYAQSMGQSRGKTEAWYVLSAREYSKIALGLIHPVTKHQLRQAIADGSIMDLVAWKNVAAGDVIVVPAGTIHALGAGLVIAEIQQRSDTTFRLFDYGRPRELHIDSALAVAKLGPASDQALPCRLSDARTLLAVNRYFTLERIELSANCSWPLESELETWLLVLNGNAKVGCFDVGVGEAIFIQSHCVEITAGSTGMSCLVAFGNGAPASEDVQPDFGNAIAVPLGMGTSTVARRFRSRPV